MSYNKCIISNNQLELYVYEKEPQKRFGRQNTRVKRDYKSLFTSVEFPDYRDNPLFKAQRVQRRYDNAQRASSSFRRIILSNLCPVEIPLFFTLTFREEYTDVRKTARFFNLFIIRMRRLFGSSFRYIAVPEFQKSGRVHYHALFWGLSECIAERERSDRKIASIWSMGFVDVKKTDNSPKIASYMAKYMTKSMKDERFWNCKSYFASRNISRPKVFKGVPYWWLKDEYIGLNDLPEYQSEFSTGWLGKAIYKRYNIST